MREPGHERGGERDRVEAGQMRGDIGAKRVAEVEVGEHRVGQLGTGGGHGEHLAEQVGDVEHLDPAGPQRLRECVMLLLGTADPWYTVEEQRVAVARGQPREFRPGAM
jgi:hypothetical protein